MHPATDRFLGVPELIGLTCNHTSNPDLFSLLTVSRRFFYCVAPLIWRDAPGIIQLVNLLPNNSGKLQLRLEPFDQMQLARFNIYTPFIQNFQLDIVTRERWPNWEVLVANVPTRPLLPNLRVLVVDSQKSGEGGSGVEQCINAFLGPTLIDIRTTWGRTLQSDSVLTTRTLLGVARSCPNLERLRMRIGDTQYYSNSDRMDGYSKAAILLSIPWLHNLRVLSSSPIVLDYDILQLLGKLPHLESLTVYSSTRQHVVRLVGTTQNVNDDQVSVAGFALSTNLFPALQHLKIHLQPSAVVFKLWRTAPLVQGLVSVAVKPTQSSVESFNNLVGDICRSSPFVTDLQLDLVSNISGPVELSIAVMDHLRQMPLQRVRIRNGHADCQYLMLALRNVEYLEIEAMRADLSDLVLMSKNMPKLQYLCATLVLNWPADSHLSDCFPSPRTCRFDSYFRFENKFGLDNPDLESYVELVALTLYSLWPKGVHCGFCMNAKLSCTQGDIDIVERINAMTREWSGTSALDIPLAKESKSRWMYAEW